MKKTRNHLFLWLLLAALPLPGQGQERETLRFSRPEWNFGDIREEEGKVTHTFVGRNEGDEPLVIVEVTATCGCTVPSFSRKPVLPGEETPITVTFDPRTASGGQGPRSAADRPRCREA